MDNYTLLGQRIKELRRARSWSQEQLAERMGSGAKYLSSLERGQENPTLEMLTKLARALQVELVDLFNFPWLRMSETELRKKIRTAADDADLERLREIFAIMRSRDL